MLPASFVKGTCILKKYACISGESYYHIPAICVEIRENILLYLYKYARISRGLYRHIITMITGFPGGYTRIIIQYAGIYLEYSGIPGRYARKSPDSYNHSPLIIPSYQNDMPTFPAAYTWIFLWKKGTGTNGSSIWNPRRNIINAGRKIWGHTRISSPRISYQLHRDKMQM